MVWLLKIAATLDVIDLYTVKCRDSPLFIPLVRKKQFLSCMKSAHKVFLPCEHCIAYCGCVRLGKKSSTYKKFDRLMQRGFWTRSWWPETKHLVISPMVGWNNNGAVCLVQKGQSLHPKKYGSDCEVWRWKHHGECFSGSVSQKLGLAIWSKWMALWERRSTSKLFRKTSISTRTCVPCPEGYLDPTLELGLGNGPVCESLVGWSLSMGSGRAQLEKETLVRPHVGRPTTGGAIEDQWYVDQVPGLLQKNETKRNIKQSAENLHLSQY